MERLKCKKIKLLNGEENTTKIFFKHILFFGKERINKFLVYIFIFHLIDSLKEFEKHQRLSLFSKENQQNWNLLKENLSSLADCKDKLKFIYSSKKEINELVKLEEECQVTGLLRSAEFNFPSRRGYFYDYIDINGEMLSYRYRTLEIYNYKFFSLIKEFKHNLNLLYDCGSNADKDRKFANCIEKMNSSVNEIRELLLCFYKEK